MSCPSNPEGPGLFRLLLPLPRRIEQVPLPPGYQEKAALGVAPLYLWECSGFLGHRAGLGRLTGGGSRILNLLGLGALVGSRSVSPVPRWLSLRTGSTQDGASTLSQPRLLTQLGSRSCTSEDALVPGPHSSPHSDSSLVCIYSIKGVGDAPTPAQPALFSSTLRGWAWGTFLCWCLGKVNITTIFSSAPSKRQIRR